MARLNTRASRCHRRTPAIELRRGVLAHPRKREHLPLDHGRVQAVGRQPGQQVRFGRARGSGIGMAHRGCEPGVQVGLGVTRSKENCPWHALQLVRLYLQTVRCLGVAKARVGFSALVASRGMGTCDGSVPPTVCCPLTLSPGRARQQQHLGDLLLPRPEARHVIEQGLGHRREPGGRLRLGRAHRRTTAKRL